MSAHHSEILAGGRHGLEFFREFGPVHATLTGGEFDFARDFEGRYDEHGKLGFAALRADGERFAAIASELDGIETSMRNRGEAVFGVWQSGTADTARTRFDTLLSAGQQLRGQFSRLGNVVGEVVTIADQACYAKTDGVSKLHATDVDGRTAEDVTFLIEVVPRLRGGHPDEKDLDRAARLCGVRLLTMTQRAPGVAAQLASTVDGWLTGTFLAAVDAAGAQRLAKWASAVGDNEKSHRQRQESPLFASAASASAMPGSAIQEIIGLLEKIDKELSGASPSILSLETGTTRAESPGGHVTVTLTGKRLTGVELDQRWLQLASSADVAAAARAAIRAAYVAAKNRADDVLSGSASAQLKRLISDPAGLGLQY